MTPGRRTADAPRRGFTLLEVLLTLVLVMGLLGAMFAFLWDMLATRVQILDASERHRAATILIDRLERDLATCIAGNAQVGAGLRGDASSIRILSRDVPVRLAMRGVDEGRVFADLEQSEYRFRRGAVEARRSVVIGSDDLGDGAGAFQSIGGGIPQLHFRYFDGDAWLDAFDSLAAGRLPVAVEVAIWFQSWGDDEGADLDPFEDDGFEGDVFDDAPGPARRTFDATRGFVERRVADATDRDQRPPVPDRVRVIAVPDAAPDTSDSEAP